MFFFSLCNAPCCFELIIVMTSRLLGGSGPLIDYDLQAVFSDLFLRKRHFFFVIFTDSNTSIRVHVYNNIHVCMRVL